MPLLDFVFGAYNVPAVPAAVAADWVLPIPCTAKSLELVPA
jgi:hypothetical protein